MKNPSIRIPLFIGLGLLVFFSCIPPNSPKGIAKKFLTAMNDKDYDLAKAYASEETQSSIDVLKEMPAMGKESSEKSGIKIVKQDVDGNTATVYYKAKGELKMVELEKQGDSWKVIMSKEDLQGIVKAGDEDSQKNKSPKIFAKIGKNPEKVAEKFLQAFSKGDYSEAGRYCTESTKSALDVIAALSKESSKSPSPFTITGSEIQDNQTLVFYSQEGKEKKISLQKEGQIWLVNMTKMEMSQDNSGISEELQKALEGITDSTEIENPED